MEELYWYFYLFCLGLFLVLVHLTPDQVTLLQSNAYTTLLQWNYGKDSLELQSICVIVYHQSLLGRLTHLTLITDNIAWIILSCSNFYLFIAITLLPLFQAVTLSKDKSYIFSLNLSWILLCIGGFLSHYFVDTEFLTWTCRIVVLAGAIIRTIGHVFEKVPPLIGGIDHRQFGPEIGTSFYFSLVWNFRTEILFLPFLGVLSEAAAGFPTRLWPSIVYLSYCYFKNPSELTKLREASEKISDNGWTSHPITQKLFGWSSKKD